ncbi:MAG: hypothetical protein Q4B42_07925, partial [Oscillospiraceae bacterium]|nr:hypothetical protein [Oscillospiraceae bacterium]
ERIDLAEIAQQILGMAINPFRIVDCGKGGANGKSEIPESERERNSARCFKCSECHRYGYLREYGAARRRRIRAHKKAAARGALKERLARCKGAEDR